MWQRAHMAIALRPSRSALKSAPCGDTPHPVVEWQRMQVGCWWHVAQVASPCRAARPCCSSHCDCAVWYVPAAPPRDARPAVRWQSRQKTSVLWHELHSRSAAYTLEACRLEKFGRVERSARLAGMALRAEPARVTALARQGA